MRSVQSVLFEKFLILRGTKKKFMDLRLLDDFIAMKHNEKPYELDAKFRDQHQIKKDELNGIHYYTINEQQTPEKVIYYFHGGAYINDPLIFHWRYLVKLAQETNFTIVVPIYPKLPKHTHRECFVAIHDLYDHLVLKYDAPFIFMGDSAGGGLAMALAQDVKRCSKKQPQHIVLHSAWLDVRGEDPRYKELEKLDPMLGVIGAQELGRLWADGLELTDYKISPVHGELIDIGQITAFVGTGELLLVDANMLLDKAKEQGVAIQYYEYPKMNHVFPVFPIPEAKKAMNQLLKIIKN
ncbi:esterase/lipase [Solibacillus silvestris StLB046]|uniref:Esterase/lipase n=2 Tax=Solibacillus TaxID=648800 RepID=F2F1M3_SOLSS|nr:alpha/beta hydrolase [Solibacillus silvestris]BAK16886.1 esterase/lipase [Solibacillus silvestris StLB046]